MQYSTFFDAHEKLNSSLYVCEQTFVLTDATISSMSHVLVIISATVFTSGISASALSSSTPHGFSIERLKIDLVSYSVMLYTRINANAVIETFKEFEYNN